MIRNVVFDMGNVIRIYDPLRPCMRHAGNQEEAEALCQAIFLHPDWGRKVDGGLLTDLEYAKEVQNRLDSPRLQKLTQDILNMDDPYNTRLYKGLPPGPISNPTFLAINYAFYPDKTDYFYFVAKKDGYNLFAKTEKEHEKNKQEAFGDSE